MNCDLSYRFGLGFAAMALRLNLPNLAAGVFCLCLCLWPWFCGFEGAMGQFFDLANKSTAPKRPADGLGHQGAIKRVIVVAKERLRAAGNDGAGKTAHAPVSRRGWREAVQCTVAVILVKRAALAVVGLIGGYSLVVGPALAEPATVGDAPPQFVRGPKETREAYLDRTLRLIMAEGRSFTVVPKTHPVANCESEIIPSLRKGKFKMVEPFLRTDDVNHPLIQKYTSACPDVDIDRDDEYQNGFHVSKVKKDISLFKFQINGDEVLVLVGDGLCDDVGGCSGQDRLITVTNITRCSPLRAMIRSKESENNVIYQTGRGGVIRVSGRDWVVSFVREGQEKTATVALDVVLDDSNMDTDSDCIFRTGRRK